MRRLIAILTAWSTLALCIADSHPAKPLYEPPTPAKAPPPAVVSVNLNNTNWLGKYNSINRIYIFEADGTVSYKSTVATAKPFKNRGSWRVEGNTLYFDHHIGAARMLEFRGTIRDPNTIVGEQTMVKTGIKTNVTMQRTKP